MRFTAILLIALGALAFWAWHWWQGISDLTDAQVQELVDEYACCLFVRDDFRAHEILIDLQREGVTVRLFGGSVMWERD